MPETSKLEKLNWELEKSEKKLRKAINDEKALQYQLKQLTRKERTSEACKVRPPKLIHRRQPLMGLLNSTSTSRIRQTT